MVTKDIITLRYYFKDRCDEKAGLQVIVLPCFSNFPGWEYLMYMRVCCFAPVIFPWTQGPIPLSTPPIKKRTSQSLSNKILKERDDMDS